MLVGMVLFNQKQEVGVVLSMEMELGDPFLVEGWMVLEQSAIG